MLCIYIYTYTRYIFIYMCKCVVYSIHEAFSMTSAVYVVVISTGPNLNMNI